MIYTRDMQSGNIWRNVCMLINNFENSNLIHTLTIQFQKKIFRMRTPVARTVHWLDINIVVVSFSIAGTTAIVSLRNTRRINSLLRKVNTFTSFPCKKTIKEKKRFLFLGR